MAKIHYYEYDDPSWWSGRVTTICGISGLRTKNKKEVTCLKCLKILNDPKLYRGKYYNY